MGGTQALAEKHLPEAKRGFFCGKAKNCSIIFGGFSNLEYTHALAGLEGFPQE
jgi:hypothetical protein